MPVNNNLKPTTFPMQIKFDEIPVTEFHNNLENIDVKIEYAPTMDDLRNFVPNFALATWADKPEIQDLTEIEKDKAIYMVFREKLLPSTLETIRPTFLLKGISYQDVTHILRYRGATFSAECSGDKWWTDKDVVVPTSIQNSPEFYTRYKELSKQIKQLYCDMLDSREISLLDARFILHRGMETYYHMSISLREALHFIKHRIDKQIQPDSDNVIAYRMWEALIDRYPLLVDIIDIHQPAMFYVKTARTGRCTNLFVPDADTDIYEWNEEDYLYGRTRDKVNGTDKKLAESYYPFGEILKNLDAKIARIKKENIAKYGEDFFKI